MTHNLSVEGNKPTCPVARGPRRGQWKRSGGVSSWGSGTDLRPTGERRGWSGALRGTHSDTGAQLAPPVRPSSSLAPSSPDYHTHTGTSTTTWSGGGSAACGALGLVPYQVCQIGQEIWPNLATLYPGPLLSLPGASYHSIYLGL